MNKKTRVLVIGTFAMLLVLQQLMQTVVPFFSSEYNSAGEAIDAAVSISNEDNKEEVIVLNMSLNLVFVEDTALALTKDGKYYAAQGHYYYDGNTGKVVYCLDPTVMTGEKVAYEEMSAINKHTLGKFDVATQDKIITLGLAANDLYNQTGDDKYILVGQYLVWEAAGSELLQTDAFLNEYMDKVKMNAVNFQAKIDNGDYGKDRATILLNTSGQDLIGLVNAPVITKKPSTDAEAPNITAQNYTVIVDAQANGQDLINVSKLKNSDFKAYAFDKEDGNLTNKITADYSKVDATKAGVYEVTFTVTDASGNTSTTTALLRIFTSDTTYNDRYMLNSTDITVDNLDELKADSSKKLYQDLAKVYGFDVNSGAALDVYSLFGKETNYPANEVSPKLTVVNVTNSTDKTFGNTNSNHLTNKNYIYAVENLSDLDGTPGLYANNMQSKLGDDLDTSKLGALAIEFDTGKNISSQIKYNTSKVDTSKVGVYPIVISVKAENGKTNELTRYVTITSDDSIVGPKQEVMIDAKNVFTDQDTISSFVDQAALNNFIIEQANAIGLSMITGEDLVVNVDSTNLKTTSSAGIYTAKLSTTNGNDTAVKTITIYVSRGSDVIDDQKPYITANKVIVNKGETVDNQAYKAAAFDKQDGNLTSKISYPQVDTSKVGPVRATLSVKDKDGNVGTTQVIVTVIDENTEVTEDKEVGLYAIDFTTDILTTGAMTQSELDKMLLSMSHAYGFSTTTGETLPVTIESSTITPTSPAGSYEVAFTVTNGTSTITNTITVTIQDAEMSVSASDIVTNEKALSAVTNLEDFIFTNGKVSSNAAVKTKALTTTYGYDLGSLSVNSKVGTYPVTITADNTVVSGETAINVFVLPGDTVIPEDQDEPFLYAENVRYDLNDPVNNADFGAYAFDGQDGDITSKIVYPTVDTSIDGVQKVTLTVTDNDGNVATKEVLVAVNGENTEVSPEGDLYLTGYDVYTNEKTIASASDLSKYIIEQAKAQGYDLVTSEELPVTINLMNLNKDSKFGTYEVVLSTTNGTQIANNPIKVYVAKGSDVIPTDKPYITSGNMRKNVGDSLDPAEYNAYAVDRQEGEITSEIVFPDLTDIMENDQFSKFGVFARNLTVTDQDGNSSTSTSLITVLGEDSEISTDGKLAIDAKDIYTNEATVSSQTNLNNFILTSSHAQAFMTETGVALTTGEMQVTSTNLKLNSKAGVYTATIEATKDGSTVTKTIDIYVAKGSDVIDSEKPYITAENFIVNKDATVTQEMFEALAFDMQEGDLTAKIDYKLPVDTSKPGIVKHTISVTDKDGNVSTFEVVITVKDEDMVISPDSMVGVRAENIYTNVDTVSSQTNINDYILAASNATGYDLGNGSSIAPVVETTNLTVDSKAGVYTATITVTKGSSVATKEVKIIVTKGGEVIDSEKPYITANNIIVEKNAVVDNAAYKAVAFDKQDGDLTSVIKYPTVDTSKVGPVSVTLSVEDKSNNVSTTQVIVTVVDENTEVTEDKEVGLYAVDFTTDILSLGAMTQAEIDSMIITSSKAYGFSTVTGETLTVTIETSAITPTTVAGSYEVVLTTTNGTSTITNTIIVTVQDAEMTVTANDIVTNEATLSGVTDLEGFIFTKGNVASSAAVKTKALTTTYSYEVGSLTATSPVGTYPVTITADNTVVNAQTEINVFVLPGDTVVPENQEEPYLYAENVKYNVGDTPSNSDFNAYAFDNQDGDITTKIVYPTVDTSVEGIVTVTLKVTDNNGNATPKDVLAAVAGENTEISPEGDVYLTAFNVYTNENAISSASDLAAFIIEQSKAQGYDLATRTKLAVTADLQELTKDSTYGTYDVELTTTNGEQEASLPIKVFVAKDGDVIPTDKPYITSVDVRKNVGDSFDDSEYEAYAVDRTAGDITSEIIFPSLSDIMENNKFNKFGVFPQVLSVTSNSVKATSTSYITVLSDDSIVSPDGKIALDAKNIYTNVDTVASQTNINDFILTTSEAQAFMIETGIALTGNELTVISTTLTSGSKAGEYTATIEASKDGSAVPKEIKIYVAKDSDVIDDEKPYLTAENFIVDQDTEITSDMFNAAALDKQDGNITGSIEYNLPIDTTTPGAIIHTISVKDKDGNEVTFEVVITVKDKNTVISPDGKVAVRALDIYTNENTVASQTDINSFILDQSEASGYVLETGESLEPYVKVTNLTPSSVVGVYNATIEATDGTSTAPREIKIYVARDGDVVDDTKPYITADKVIVNKDSAVAAGSYNAMAFDKQDGDLTSKISYPTVDTSSVGPKNATLTVTDKNGNTSTTTVIVTVIDGDTEISNDSNVALYAIDFTTDVLTIGAMTQYEINAMIISNSNAYGFDTNKGDTLTVTIDTSSITPTSPAGEYEVILTATNGTSTVTKTITVTIQAAEMTVTANDIVTNEATLSAVTDLEDFIFTNGNVASNAAVKTRALTTTYSYEMGSLATTSPVGTYPVTITADNTVVDAQTEIKVFVLPGDTVVPENQEEPYLYAENVKYNVGDTPSDSDFGAYAFDNQDGDITNKIVYPTVNTSVEGIVTVTLSVTDNDGNPTTKDVLAAVAGDNTKVSPEGDVYLTAFNVYTNEDTLSSTSDLTSFIIEQSKAQGYDMATSEALAIVVDLQGLTKDSTYGTYEVNLTTKNGEQEASRTIKVFVAKDGDVIPTDKPYITSANVSKNIGDILEVKDYNAYAVDRMAGDITNTINYPDVSAIQDAESKFNKFGSYAYELSVESNGNTATSTSVITVLSDDSVISPDGKLALNAKDIYTNVATVSSLTDIDEYILTTSEAQAFMLETGTQVGASAFEVTATTLKTDSPAGVYTATIKVTNEGSTAEKEINIFIAKENDVIDDDKPYITAENFIVDKDTVVTADLFKGLAFDKQDGDLTAVIDYKLPVDTSTGGIVKHTISVEDDNDNVSTFEVIITVKDDSMVISPDEKVAVRADDIYTNMSTLSGYGNTVNEFILATAKAQGYDLTDGSTITPTVASTNLSLTSGYGTYTATIEATKYGSTAPKTINIYVAKGNDVIDGEKPYLAVSDVRKNVGDPLSIDDFKAYAVDTQDGDITAKIKAPSISAYVDSEGNAKEFGVYKLSFEVSDNNGNKIVETAILTILTENSKVDPTGNYVINAENIYTNVNSVKPIIASPNEFIITESKAKSYNLNTAVNTGVSVASTTLKAEPGVYTATVQVANPAGAVSKQIKIFVAAGSDTVDNDKPYLTGQNVVVDKDTGDVPRASYKVVAFDVQDGDLTKSVIVPTISTDKHGVFKNTVTVTDSSGNKVEKDLYVTVKDGGETDFPDQKILTFADDIFTTENIVKAQTDINQFIFDNADPSAFDYGNLVDLTSDIEIKSETLSTLNGPGVATVEFTINGHSDVVFTINVFVTNDDDVIDSAKPYIYANSLTVNLGDTVELADFQATAFDKEDGDLTSKIVYSSVSNFIDADSKAYVLGVHKVTLYVQDTDIPNNTASINVFLTVIDETSTIKDNLVIFAESPLEATELQLARVSGEAEIRSEIKKNADAKAYDMLTGDLVTVIISDLGGLVKGGAPGDYTVTLTATKGGRSVSKDIIIKILDVNIDQDVDDIYTNVDTLSSQTDLNEFILSASNATAINDIGDSDGMIIKVESTTLKLDSPYGVYDATISAFNGIDKVVGDIKIFVAKNGDTMDDELPYLTASNFVIQRNETVTAEDFGAVAFDNQDGDLSSEIDYGLPFDSSKEGVFKHTISVKDADLNNVEYVVYITVLGPDTIINPEGAAILNAQNLFTNVETLSAQGANLESYLKTQTKLLAMLTVDGTDITGDVVITKNDVKLQPGVYDLTYEVTPPAGNGSKLTKTVKIFVVEGNEKPTNPYVYGQNIVKDINDEFKLEDLNPVAFSNTEGDLTDKIVYDTSQVVTVDDNGTLRYSEVGVFPVTLKITSAGKTDTHIAYITVKDENSTISEPVGAMIRAEDFTVVDFIVADAGSDLTSLILERSKAIAYDMKNGEEIEVKIDSHNIEAKGGDYTATLSATANGQTVVRTINVKVIDSKIEVSANDIYTNVQTLKGTANIQQMILIESGAEITAGIGSINRNDIVTDLTRTSSAGEYSATIYGKNPLQTGSTTIKIYVAAAGDVIPDDSPYIIAEDIQAKVGDAYSNEIFNGFAVDKTAGNLTDKINYSAADVFQTDNVFDKFGVFPTELTLDGYDASTTVMAMITTDNTVIEGDLLIDGYDVFTNVSTLSNHGDIDEYLISESQTAGYRISDGEVGTVTVKSSNVEHKPGTYEVTYVATFADNSTIELTRAVYVAKGTDEIPSDGNPYITANNYSATVGEIVNHDKFGIVGFDFEFKDDVTISVTPYSTDNVGVFDVVITVSNSSGKSKSITVKLTVTSENSQIENEMLLDFNHISTNTDTIKSQTDLDAFIKEQANVLGYDLTASSNVTGGITVTNKVEKGNASNEFTTSSGPGLYTADFTATSVDGTRTIVRTVNIFVAQDGDILDDEKPYLTANDVTVNVGDEVTDSMFGAVAFDKKDLDNLTVKYPASYDTSYPHVEQVTLSVTDSNDNTTTTEVVLVVKGTNSVVENNVLIDASGFETTELELREVTDINAWLKSNTKVVAYDLTDGSTITDIAITTTIESTSTNGEYAVKFTATSSDGKTASITITVKVLDTEIALTAKSIYTNEAATATLDTEEQLNAFILEQSNATALHVLARSAINVSVDWTDATVETPAGEYAAEIKAESSVGEATAFIRIVVLPGDSTVNSEGLFIYANNVTVNVGESVTLDMFGTYGYDEQTDTNIEKYQFEPGSFDTSKQGVTSVQITGTTNDGRSISTTVKLIVKDPNMVVSEPDGNVGVVAYDFTTNTNTLASQTDINSYILAQSKAAGMDLVNAVAIDPTLTVTTLAANSPAGVYTATISATDGTETANIPINIFVANGDDVITMGETYIYAKNAEVDRVDNGTVDVSEFDAVAMNTAQEPYDLTSTITPESFDISQAGVFKHTLTAGSGDYAASTDVILVVIGEDTEVDKDNRLLLDAQNIYTNENTLRGVSDINKFLLEQSNAVAYNMDTAAPLTMSINNISMVTPTTNRGVYSIMVTGTEAGTGKPISKLVDVVVLANDDIMPENGSYIFAENASGDRSVAYDANKHNAFAYDKGRGLIQQKDLTIEQSVNVGIGEKYPVKFSFTNRDGEEVSITVIYEVLMLPMQFEGKINAMNLDAKFKIDTSNYTSVTDYTYNMEIRTGTVVGEGELTTEPITVNHKTASQVLTFSGDKLGLTPGGEYNIGFYEVGKLPDGTPRNYLVSGFEYYAPNIDPGPNNKVYSCGTTGTGGTYGTLNDPCSGDNISLIKDVYELESIGYEELPQPGRIDWTKASATESQVDLTIAKYGYNYRPFNGNYRLSGDIDASASKLDQRSDALGGFGTDGFKPIGFRFQNTKAWGSTGSATGTGFDSVSNGSFTGTFDGAGYTIDGLYANRYEQTGNMYGGLFAQIGTSGAKFTASSPSNVHSFTFKNGEILAANYLNVGGIIGDNYGKVSYINQYSDVTGNRYVGGVAAQSGAINSNSQAYMDHINVDANIISTYFTNGDLNVSGAGGVVGYNMYGVVEYSSAAGYIYGTDNTGAIAGRDYAGKVRYNYSTMYLDVHSNCGGGIVGYGSAYETRVTDNVSLSDVVWPQSTGLGYYMGGAVGWNDGYAERNIVSGYISGRERVGGATGFSNGDRSVNNVVIGSQMFDTNMANNTGKVVQFDNGTLKNYYTPNTRVFENATTAVKGADPLTSVETPIADMQVKSWWTTKGYTEEAWDFSRLEEGYAPQLKDKDGSILAGQPLIPLDTKVDGSIRPDVPAFG